MKKFLILLVILLLSTSGIFFLGWVQFRLQPGESALLFSKTQGWEDRVIESGDFEWRWQALLPTNLKIYRFVSSSYPYSYRFEKVIPGSSLYGVDIDQENFTLGFTIDLQLSLSREGYRKLIMNQGSNLEDDFFLSKEVRDREFESLMIPKVQSAIDILGNNLLGHYSSGPEPPEFSLVIPLLRENLESAGDYLVDDLSVRNIVEPNGLLFRTLENRYLALTEASIAGESEVENQLAQARAIELARVQRMEDYGQILEKYPSILEYLRIVGETNIDPLEITNN